MINVSTARGGGGAAVDWRREAAGREQCCLWRSVQADQIRWLPSPLLCTGLRKTTNVNHERSKSQQY